MHRRIDLNLQPVKNTYHLGQKACWINIFVLRLLIMKVLLRRTVNPFIPNAPFRYPLKTSKNRQVLCWFQELEKRCIGNKWVNIFDYIFFLQICLSLLTLHCSVGPYIHYSLTMLNCRRRGEGELFRGGGFFQIFKTGWGHNKMTLWNFGNLTLKWGSLIK